MDPNETLAALRGAVARLDAGEDAADDVVEAFEALDSWLSKGGFAPGDWSQGVAR